MYRIDTPNSTTDGQFVDGSPLEGVAPTIIGHQWLNGVQGELVNVVEASGQALEKGNVNQLLAAILVLAGAELVAETAFELEVEAPRNLSQFEFFNVGDLWGIAKTSALFEDDVTMVRTGTFVLTKLAGDTWSRGDTIYWDVSTGFATADGNWGGKKRIGFAAGDGLASAETGAVILTGDTSAATAVAWNMVAMMMDDAGLSQCPWEADRHRWPGEFPYPNCNFLVNTAKPLSLRMTNARVNARCAPTRASIASGRSGHITPSHPHGTGIGDVDGQNPVGQDPFYDGLTSAHNPWPAVAKAAGSTHALGHFGKWHLYNYSPAAGNVTNRRSPIDVGGFDVAHQVGLTGAGGGPFFGYYNFPYYYNETNAANDTTTNPVTGVFSPTFLWEKMVEWLEEQVAAKKPFFMNWWMNMPHGLLPAIEQLIGPDIGNGPERLHTTYTYEQLVPDAAGPNGETAEGGYYADGTPYPGYVFTDQSSEPYLSAPYGPEGQVHVSWRRGVSMFECLDRLTEMLYQHLETLDPVAAAATMWMQYSDNGAAISELTPLTTAEFGPSGQNLGPEYANVIPPTADGTDTGDPYHNAQHAKGSIHDEGILTPLLIWGRPIPENLRGTDCDRVIGAQDFYNTFLDVVAPGVWEDSLGATELAKVDGVSFFDNLFTGDNTGSDYSYHSVFYPGWVEDINAEVFEYEQAVIGGPNSTDAAGYKLSRTYEKTYPSGPIVKTKTLFLYDLNADPDESNDLRPYAQANLTEPEGLALLELIDAYTAHFDYPSD